MLKVEQLSKTYGKHQALDQLSFSLKKGEIVALLGPNGAGKSTTMKILTGFLLPDSGNIYIDGLPLLSNAGKGHNHRIKQKIGYLPENNPLYPDLLVREYLQFIGQIYGISWGSKEIKYLLEKVGLGQKMNQKIQNLSKGYKQRVGLAQALLHNPDLLILDEPTTGLDPNQIVEIRALIQELGQEKTILLSTHILQEVQVCSDVILLHQGKMITHQKTNTLGNQIIEIETEYPHFTSSLAAWGEIQQIQKVGNFKYEILTKTNTISLRKKIAEWAVNQGVVISTLYEKPNSIEKIFQELTK